MANTDPAEALRGIAVLDAGSTNTKLFLFDYDLNLVAEESTESVHVAGPPYLHIDPDPVLAFAERWLPRFDALLPVDVVVPCSHGSGLALLDGDGRTTLPLMFYTAEPPAGIARLYAGIAPPFDEVFAPTNPGALTLGRQLLWQETLWPEAFARTATILPWAQFIGFRLGGRPVTEVTALGAQTHLLDVRRNAFSSLARTRGWADRFAPRAGAWDRIGRLGDRFRGPGLRGRGEICAGIHDSSANFLRYIGAEAGRFTLLSTGTWIIGFDQGADITRLDPAFDLVTNTTIHGDPVASCRFMGGAEFQKIAGSVAPEAATLDRVRDLVRDRVMALPSFTDSGGPAPGTGSRGHIVGDLPDDAGRASLAALYCAQMTAASLRAMWAGAPSPRVIVDGPFSQNGVYLACLAALLPGTAVAASTVRNGTAAGAALLALADDEGRPPPRRADSVAVAGAEIPGLADYDRDWQTRAGGRALQGPG